ncbi:hypothetical protein T4E_9052 [Trichinella pseudospiralis]|uniref:Uncharacterized protein n=1 Tax=Trichinella pseudospiralis TaxID=6337 RepID=A0A0V0Y6W8_TRIPS|nr:hypothetical protein T4E_9052 [Trichinella pseudospiralis]
MQFDYRFSHVKGSKTGVDLLRVEKLPLFVTNKLLPNSLRTFSCLSDTTILIRPLSKKKKMVRAVAQRPQN